MTYTVCFSDHHSHQQGRRVWRAVMAVCMLLAMLFGMANAAMAESAAAQSLRTAVISGGTVTLSGDITLESSLTIPAGTTVTINGTGKLKGTSAVQDLIVVEAGAAVIFGGDVELNGAGITGSIISTKGNVAVTEKVKITGAEIKSSYTGTDLALQEAAGTGAVKVLNGGYLRLQGGSITGNTVRSDYCGTVYVADGGKISIESGADISGNTAYNGNAKYTLTHATSGVFLHGGAEGRMTGGNIYKNQAMRGAAIMLYSVDDKKQASFTFSGGEIYENIGKTDSASLESCGAVLVEGSAFFLMQNGVSTVPVIRNNSAAGIATSRVMVGSVGGGVCVRDPGLGSLSGQSNQKEFGTQFVLNGGRISGNSASTGGGIYSFSNGVKLQAGTISNNKAIRKGIYGLEMEAYAIGGIGGGVYCEGNTVGYSTLEIRDAVITQNLASCQGGGLWFCTTGSATIYARHGASIHSNDAMGFFNHRNKNNMGAGDDLFFGAAVSSSQCGKPNAVPTYQVPSGPNGRKAYPSLTLADQALSGVNVEWYMDGFAHSHGMEPSYNNSLWELNTRIFIGSSDPRYQAGRNPRVSGVQNSCWFYDASLDANHYYAYALKCIATEAAFRQADRGGKLLITGNEATFGGGIGSNGGVIIGEEGQPDTRTIVESKPPQTGDRSMPGLWWLMAFASAAGAVLLFCNKPTEKRIKKDRL